MNWISHNVNNMAELTLTHLWLALSAIAIATVISVPVGWIAQRFSLGRTALLGLISALYAIPSLPMFILVPIITGTSMRSQATMVIVLSIYAVAVLTRSCADAFGAVSPAARTSAVAVGYSPWQSFLNVELPLATPVIIAGLRVAAVSTVSLVTVGAVVGIKSLGTLFTDGFQRNIVAEVAMGLVLTVVLALLVDAMVVLLGRLLTPWTRARGGVGA